MAANFRLGIQSYCFRKFLPLKDLIGCLSKVGLKYVEIWPGHQSAEVDQTDIERTIRTLGENGITIDSYGQVKFTTDQAAARAAFEFCHLAGVKAITADVEADAIEQTEALCEEYDINIAIHNHGRKHCYGKMAQLDELFSQTSKRFGLCLDTAWMLDAGDDPLAAVERYKDRLYGVHLKDFVFGEDGKPKDVIIGTGGLDLPKLMGMLDSMDYGGYLSLEYEGDADAPLPAVAKCVEVVQQTIKAVQG